MTLQGYFDDSGSSANEPIYVLAGFVSDYPTWAHFSDKWRAALDREGIAYLKMSEAMRRDGEFARGWSASHRDAFIYELVETIAKHTRLRVSASVKRSDFEDLFHGLPARGEYMEDPYQLLFWGICRLVVEAQFRAGQTEPCDFIFDTHGATGERARAWWPHWDGWIHPSRRHLLGDPPMFRDEKRALPIQAADMYAWLVRHRLLGPDVERWQAKAFFKALQCVPVQHFRLTRDRLVGLRASLTIQHLKFVGEI